MKPKGYSRLFLNSSAITTLIVATLAAPFARAASATWNGTSSATWATLSNWDGPPAAVPDAGNTATLNNAGNANTILDLGTGVTLGAMVFDTASAAAYTIGSGAVGSQTLTLGTVGNALTVNATVANNQSVNANLALSTTGAYSFANNSASSLTIAGAISASTAGAKTLTVTGTGNTSVGGNITNGTGTVALGKTGTGTLSLGGTNLFTGALTVGAGRLSVTAGTTTASAAFNNIGNAASTTAITSTAAGSSLVFGGANGGNYSSAASASSALYNLGTFDQTITTVNNAGIYLGNAANTYGYLLNSGTATVAGRLWLSQAANAAGATSVLDVRGGTVSVNPTGNFTANQRLQINGDGNAHATSTSYAGMNVVNGTLTVGGSASQILINAGQNEYSSINITGTGKWTAGNAATDSGIGLNSTNSATNTVTLSVANGGTLETSYIFNNSPLAKGAISFDNGTIRSIFNNPTGIIQGTNTKTYIQSGGATFDTNGFATKVPNPLLAPTGNGVSAISLGGTLTGYVGAPVVAISGDGTGAAAIANFDAATGTVTGITISSAGSGYTTAPTVTLVGGNGGATGAGVGTATAIATIAPVTGGGIVKSGTGTLTLSGANTYTGNTTVNGGILSLSIASLADTSAVVIGASGVLDLPHGATDQVAALTINGVVKANGTYDATTDPGFITGTGKILVQGAVSGYASWTSSHGLTAGVNDGANDDPDFDGISNLLEYVLGGNPIGAGASDTSILPIQSLDATNLTLTFHRSDLSESDTVLKVQYSTNLTTWSDFATIGAVDALPAVDITEDSPTTDLDTVVVKIPQSGNESGGKLFGRVNAVKP
ncbi:MAG: autotransporter-associated beta strand repeat-containing protein [Luteolibacter sp.]